MAHIIVRNLDGSIVERLKNKARINGRSLEADARLIQEL
jgi:plasmid stability protein